MPNIKKKIEIKDLTKGQKKQFDIAKKGLKDERRVCFYGPAGTGKTTMVYLLAGLLGRKVIEFNASDTRTKNDIAQILRRIRTRTMRKVLYLFDEVDNFKNWKQLKVIFSFSIHPIMMTCNEYWKLPNSLKKDPKVKFMGVRIYPPNKGEIRIFLKEQGVKEGNGLSAINQDWRSSVNASSTLGDTYGEVNYFKDIRTVSKDVESIICHPETVPDLIAKYKSGFSKFYIWILDNIPLFYHGKDMYDAFNILARAELLNCPELLTFLPKGKGDKVEYPHFFKKRKIHGKKEKKKK